MNKRYIYSVLTGLIVAMMIVGFSLTSCDEVECCDPPQDNVGITITNNSSNTFNELYIMFVNSIGETIKMMDLGKCFPQDIKTISIPKDARTWCLVVRFEGLFYVSDDFQIYQNEYQITNGTTWYLME